MTWTVEEAATLKDLRIKGLSYSEIGRRLGKTRNACCARADRDGLMKITPATPPKLGRTWSRQDDERDLDFLDDIAEGMPTRVAAREHGISNGHAQRMVREYWNGEAE
jgi:hypothetical protein